MACGRTEGAETVWDLPGDRLKARSEHGHPVRGGQGGVYWWR